MERWAEALYFCLPLCYSRGMNNEMPIARPATTNGKISAISMVIALARSGCPLEGTKLYEDMSDADKAQVRAALA